ncbi:MAG: hypothetical protein PF541_08560 [Prolixibacteraceae bacterium]|jgi:hypothetical protein|nr:hypothetical protein [Prolixibacteraceae bacterium]
MIKSTFLIAFVMLAFTTFAQTNFSGTWELSKTKSTLNAEFSFAPTKLVIEQKGNDLAVERHSEFQGNAMISNSKFTLDGKECINTGWQDSKMKSKVNWTEDKKALDLATKIPMQDGNEMLSEEKYQVLDGDLNIKIKTTSSWGVMEETWVFEKK